MTPWFLKFSISWLLTGSWTLPSLINAKVGWPAFALASTRNFPMFPVHPMIKILLFSAIDLFFFMGEQEEKWIIKLRRYKFSRRCIEPSSQFIDWNERITWGPVSYFGKSVSIIGKITLIIIISNNKLCCQNQAINTY